MEVALDLQEESWTLSGACVYLWLYEVLEKPLSSAENENGWEKLFGKKTCRVLAHD